MSRWIAICAVTVGCLVVAGHGDVVNEDFKLLASDGAEDDYFGESVSISGDAAVIGSPFDDDNGVISGSAYIYRSDGSGWVEEAKLLASDGATGDRFGESVSIDGDTVAIGAYSDSNDGNGTDSGSVYVYHFNGSQWVQITKLLAADGQVNDFFGWSVSISGDAMVIGAWGDDDNSYNSGSAYIFRFDGEQWIEEAKLLASDGAYADHFGESVSISGDTVLIGAHADTDNGFESGSAYVYRFDGSGWVEEAKLLASDGEANARFGYSVSVSDNTAVIGAKSGDWSASAYVYQFDESEWVEGTKLLVGDGVAGNWFGNTISISGNTVVIGAWGEDGSDSNCGSAYVYRSDGSGWVEEARLLASDGAEWDEFGYAVSTDGDTVVIGAYRDGTDDFGSAYVFELGDDDCPADVTNDGVVGVDDVLAVVSAWGTSDPDADIDGNGTVGTDDLLAVLSGWGLCE